MCDKNATDRNKFRFCESIKQLSSSVILDNYRIIILSFNVVPSVRIVYTMFQQLFLASASSFSGA